MAKTYYDPSAEQAMSDLVKYLRFLMYLEKKPKSVIVKGNTLEIKLQEPVKNTRDKILVRSTKLGGNTYRRETVHNEMTVGDQFTSNLEKIAKLGIIGSTFSVSIKKGNVFITYSGNNPEETLRRYAEMFEETCKTTPFAKPEPKEKKTPYL